MWFLPTKTAIVLLLIVFVLSKHIQVQTECDLYLITVKVVQLCLTLMVSKVMVDSH